MAHTPLGHHTTSQTLNQIRTRLDATTCITTCIHATMIWVQYLRFFNHVNTKNQGLQRYEITKMNVTCY